MGYTAHPNRDEPDEWIDVIVEGKEGSISRSEFRGAVQMIDDRRNELLAEPEVCAALEDLQVGIDPDETMDPPHQGVPQAP